MSRAPPTEHPVLAHVGTVPVYIGARVIPLAPHFHLTQSPAWEQASIRHRHAGPAASRIFLAWLPTSPSP
jgi:xanthosine utilization system XapX-like protein